MLNVVSKDKTLIPIYNDTRDLILIKLENMS